MNEKHTITELHAEANRLTEQAKTVRNQIGALPGLVSDHAHQLGHSLTMIGAEFQALAVELKQATRNAADHARREIAP